LIEAEESRQDEARRWSEWLAFAPFLAITGQTVPTFEEFKNTGIPVKKELPDTVFDDIRKIFKLTGG